MKNIFIVPRSNKINNPYLRQYLLNKEAREVGFLGFVFSRNIDVHWIDEVVSSRRYIKLIMICLFVVYVYCGFSALILIGGVNDVGWLIGLLCKSSFSPVPLSLWSSFCISGGASVHKI